MATLKELQQQARACGITFSKRKKEDLSLEISKVRDRTKKHILEAAAMFGEYPALQGLIQDPTRYDWELNKLEEAVTAEMLAHGPKVPKIPKYDKRMTKPNPRPPANSPIDFSESVD